MDRRYDPKVRRQISRSLKGRVPWNKGLGLKDPRIRQGIKTRKEFARLRQLIKLVYALEED